MLQVVLPYGTSGTAICYRWHHPSQMFLNALLFNAGGTKGWSSVLIFYHKTEPYLKKDILKHITPNHYLS